MIKEIALKVKDISIQSREAVLAHATYGTLDKDQDRANRGMFDKSWKENMHLLRYFLNHDKKQAPGRAIRAWDDDEHAYTQVKHGTHTLGEDVLKMIDEGVIVGVSYGFVPVKQRKIQNKGFDYFEVTHLETSVLTHWGAHDDSHVVAVKKAFNDNQAKELHESIARMEKFIRDTTASDAAIVAVQKELRKAKQLLKQSTDTAITTEHSLKECPKCRTMSLGLSDETGSIKCAECSHILVKGSQPDASSNKSELLRRKLLLLKQKMS